MRKRRIDRIDPEIAGPFKAQQSMGGPLDMHDIQAARAAADRMMAAMKERQPEIRGVYAIDKRVPGPAGAPDIAVRIYRPEKQHSTLPALLWIHGGGYMFGSIEHEDMMAKQLTVAADCAVASVEYRLAPECPFPGPVEDCYAALKWLGAHSRELGVDPNRIAIGGRAGRLFSTAGPRPQGNQCHIPVTDLPHAGRLQHHPGQCEPAGYAALETRG
jgi:acetyl esterase